MRVTVVSIVVGVFGRVPKSLEKKQGNLISEEEWGPLRPQLCYNQLEYLDDSGDLRRLTVI